MSKHPTTHYMGDAVPNMGHSEMKCEIPVNSLKDQGQKQNHKIKGQKETRKVMQKYPNKRYKNISGAANRKHCAQKM